MEIVKAHFRPEFLNRLDSIVIFDALNETMLTQILEIQLSQIAKLLNDEKNVSVEFSDELKKYLVKKGYDPAYGARPLKRVLQSEILDLLAEEIIAGNLIDGQTAKLDVKGDKVVIVEAK